MWHSTSSRRVRLCTAPPTQRQPARHLPRHIRTHDGVSTVQARHLARQIRQPDGVSTVPARCLSRYIESIMRLARYLFSAWAEERTSVYARPLNANAGRHVKRATDAGQRTRTILQLCVALARVERRVHARPRRPAVLFAVRVEREGGSCGGGGGTHDSGGRAPPARAAEIQHSEIS